MSRVATYWDTAEAYAQRVDCWLCGGYFRVHKDVKQTRSVPDYSP